MVGLFFFFSSSLFSYLFASPKLPVSPRFSFHIHELTKCIVCLDRRQMALDHPNPTVVPPATAQHKIRDANSPSEYQPPDRGDLSRLVKRCVDAGV